MWWINQAKHTLTHSDRTRRYARMKRHQSFFARWLVLKVGVKGSAQMHLIYTAHEDLLESLGDFFGVILSESSRFLLEHPFGMCETQGYISGGDDPVTSTPERGEHRQDGSLICEGCGLQLS